MSLLWLATAHVQDCLEALFDQGVPSDDVSPGLRQLVAREHVRRHGCRCVLLPFLLQRRVQPGSDVKRLLVSDHVCYSYTSDSSPR